MENNQIVAQKKVLLSLPVVNLSAVFSKVKVKAFILFSTIYNPLRRAHSDLQNSSTFSNRAKFKFPKFNKKRIFRFGFPIVIIILFVILVVYILNRLPNAQSAPNVSNQVTAPTSVATQNINKTFTFSVKDANGKDSGDFKYTILNAELQNKIIVQGQSATAVKGRIFLIINLKIDNALDKALSLNTRDYVRVILADKPDEKLAADIHNDPVSVQAISTNYTRLGLTIDASEAHKPIKLEVGEIEGTKQIITLNFKFK